MRERYYNLGPDGKTPVAVSIHEWGRRMQPRTKDGDPWRVARTELAKDVEVSTVFLGLDHSFSETGPAILFETMVFGGPLDQEQDRYSTWDDAEAGHKTMCEKVTVALGEL